MSFEHPVVWISFAMLAVATVLIFTRLVRGPSLCDRVVALDLMIILAVGAIAIFAAVSGRIQLVYPAVVVALIGFLATVAFAYYVENVGKK